MPLEGLLRHAGADEPGSTEARSFGCPVGLAVSKQPIAVGYDSPPCDGIETSLEWRVLLAWLEPEAEITTVWSDRLA